MEDTYDSNFDNDLNVNDALFDSVAFSCDGSDNDGCDDDAFLRSEVVSEEDFLDDERNHQIGVSLREAQTDDYGSEEEDIEDQRQKMNLLSKQARTQSRKSNSGGIRYVKRRRSEYTARRFKSVDMMTDRLMIHVDEYNNSNYPKHKHKHKQTIPSKALRWACLAIGLLSLAMAGFLVGDLVGHLQEQKATIEMEKHIETESTNDNNDVESNDVESNDVESNEMALDHLKHLYHETIEPIPVPFGNQHNLDFNGMQFVKHGSSLITPAFDSYVKTLEPITELRFEPGEANTTKQVILTTTNPALRETTYDQDNQEVVEMDPGLVLSIGLEANGQLWLPHTTGERIAELEKHPFHSHVRIDQAFYAPGDRFVLTINEEAIALYRNDFHELIGMWMNPSSNGAMSETTSVSSQSSSSQQRLVSRDLYAQIWFKEEESSMRATAWHDHKV